jgi:hypothetical protein
MEDSKEVGGSDSPIHPKDTSEFSGTECKHAVESQSCYDNISENPTHDKTLKDLNIVNWDGPDDPENPMNWTLAKKVRAIGIVSLITVLS